MMVTAHRLRDSDPAGHSGGIWYKTACERGPCSRLPFRLTVSAGGGRRPI